MEIKIREAVRTDSEEIIRLILELAKFEKLTPPDEAGQKHLLDDAFSDSPPFKILVAEQYGGLLGYAFYLFTYSSFEAKKTLYLEDIFISESHRNKGIGKLFLDKIMKIAKANDCGRMEWAVLDWNVNAIKFYEKLGARELKEWKYFRMEL
ncbi:MAG: GNAT family N-acetyltransferase [Bacteroidetes bacterium]|nr:GNAT family N-acetyltransferase [Bacteroidota bacterium]